MVADVVTGAGAAAVGTTLTIDQFGPARKFDGTGTVPIAPPITAYPCAVAIWVRTASPMGGSDRYAFSQSDGTGNNVVALGISSSGAAVYYTRTAGSGFALVGTTAVNDGRPHLLMVVSASNGDHRLYVDGRLEASTTQTLGALASPTVAAIGNLLRSSSQYYWLDHLGQVAVWRRAIGGGEASALFSDWDGAMAGPDAVLPLLAGAAIGVDLAGASISVATATGTVSADVTLAGATLSVSSASGYPTAQITLTAAAVAESLAAAGLSTAALVAGTATANATSTATLGVQIALSGAALSAAQAAGILTTATGVALIGEAAAAAGATGTLSLNIPLSGAALATALADGALTVAVRLGGAMAAASTAGGTLIAGTESIQVQPYRVRAILRRHQRITARAGRGRRITLKAVQHG